MFIFAAEGRRAHGDATPNTVSVEEFLSNVIDFVVSVFTVSYVTVI